jgi:hypothetical protein
LQPLLPLQASTLLFVATIATIATNATFQLLDAIIATSCLKVLLQFVQPLIFATTVFATIAIITASSISG